jgi:hypothetical protein
MAALAARRPRSSQHGDYLSVTMTFPVVAADIIYEGAFLGLDANGNVLPLSAETYLFAGVADEQVDNSLGAAAALLCRVRTGGRMTIAVAGATSQAAAQNQPVYAADDGDATLTAAGGTFIGRVVNWISGTTCDVVFKGSVLKVDSVGTADGAVLVTLTDSTGQSGTHNDTLAAQTTQVDIAGGESPTEAEFNTLLAEVRVIAQNLSDVAQKVIELVAAVRA